MAYPYVTDIANAALGSQWHLPLPTFGLLVALALVVATYVFRREVHRLESWEALPASTHLLVGDLVAVSAVAGIVGARAFDILDNPDRLLAHPASVIFTTGGFSIYGGICFGLAAGVVFLRRWKTPIAPMLDAAAPPMMLGYAVGRLGCQLAGDGDWGVASNMALKPGWVPEWLWAQTYDGNILGQMIPAPGVYPTPIYEAAMALVLFCVLLALRSRAHRPGYLFSVYLMFAGFERLLIEKIRVNIHHDLFGFRLTQAEAISLVLVIAGAVGVLVTYRSRRIWIKAAFSLATLAALSACARF
jgi:phosphatidylglycerol---prolipoprotein diacylglyceryl transferase